MFSSFPIQLQCPYWTIHNVWLTSIQDESERLDSDIGRSLIWFLVLGQKLWQECEGGSIVSFEGDVARYARQVQDL